MTTRSTSIYSLFFAGLATATALAQGCGTDSDNHSSGLGRNRTPMSIARVSKDKIAMDRDLTSLPRATAPHPAWDGIPEPFPSLYEGCHGARWLGNPLGDPIETANGTLLLLDNGAIYNSRTHKGCLDASIRMIDGRLLDNPEPGTLSSATLEQHIVDDPVLGRHRKCVVRTLIDQNQHRNDCSYENIHPFCDDDYWCSEFASWVYRNSGMSNIEGKYRHLSSVNYANQLRRVFDNFDAWIEGVSRRTAEPGDFTILDDGANHTTLIAGVTLDARHIWTIGGSEGGSVGFRARDYYNPDLNEEIGGIGKAKESFFDYTNAYIEGCEGDDDPLEITPMDFFEGTEQPLRGRNTVCGDLVGRAKHVHPTCTTAAVQVVQGSLLRDTVSIHELESITIPVSSSLGNRVELRGRCGSERDTVVVWKDRARPRFGSINVFSSGGSLYLEPIGLTDDGYWNTSDYQAAVRLDGAVEVVVDGIVGRVSEFVPGMHSASLRLIDGCGRRSASRTVEFTISSSGYLVDPGTESPDPCGPGQQRNARDQCVTVSCDGDLGWIFDPRCSDGMGCCTCAPPSHPDHDPGCIY